MTARLDDTASPPGRLVSVEGLSGVGKTYLTTRLAGALAATHHLQILPEFSARADGHTDLGQVILRTLRQAANGDHFLRGGYPGAETLALLAIKMFDYERCRADLARGRLVLEGRSIHSTAVYQSLISHPDDDHAAHHHARALLALATAWRPLPDLTILIVDDIATALRRAEHRDARTYTTEQRRLHHRAATLFTQLANDDPAHIPVLDRRNLNTDQLLDAMGQLIATAGTPQRGATARPADIRQAETAQRHTGRT
jgi:dTMP kinase